LAALLWWEAQAPATGKAGGATTGARQFSLLLMTALLALGNAASSSRTGMVQLLLLASLLVLWRHFAKTPGSAEARHLRWRLLLLALAVYALALLALPRLAGLDPVSHGLLARLAEGDSACGSRITLWGNVLHLIAQKPWLGWGWGELSYAHYITLFPGLRFCEILDNAHNLPLQLAVELGVPAAVLLCVATLWLSFKAHPWREHDPARRMAWAVLAVILLHSMLEYPLWYGPFLMAAILCLVLLRPPSADVAFRATVGRHAVVPLAAAGAASLLALVAYTAWDYQRDSQIFLRPADRDPAYQDDTLAKIQGSWLFSRHVDYAELTTTDVTRSNAAHMHLLALRLVHFSPEGRVIEKLIESAVQLGLDEEALAHMQRFRAAFPGQWARWEQRGTAAEAAPTE
ncbi:MAG: Wzy polymerase domain-containing protein, partial [Betaproteobacteria bacterium]